MSRRTQLAFAAVALATLLLIVWMSRDGDPTPDSTPVESTAGVADSAPPPSSPVDLAPPARTVATEALVVPTPPNVTPPIAETANAPCLAGVLVLADGTPAPPCRLRFVTYLRDKQTTVLGSAVFAGTDENGRFATSELCTGSFLAILDSYGGNLNANGILDAPANDLRLVVPGYLMRVRVVDVRRQPVADATVIAEGTIDDRGSQTFRLDLRTDAQGFAYLHFDEPGSFLLSASSGGLASTKDEVALRDPSGLTTHELVLTEDRRVARFRLAVTSCAEPRTPIRDFAVVFEDVATHEQVLRLTSEQMPQDGIVDRLSIGRYRVRVTGRYLGEPAYYVDQRNQPGVELVATDDEVGRLDLCVDVVGRVALRVDVPGAEPGLEAQAALVLADGTDPKRIDFRDPHESGVTFGFTIPVGVERKSEDVLVPGKHVLRISAPGCVDRDIEVVVLPGEPTHVAVELALAR